MDHNDDWLREALDRILLEWAEGDSDDPRQDPDSDYYDHGWDPVPEYGEDWMD